MRPDPSTRQGLQVCAHCGKDISHAVLPSHAAYNQWRFTGRSYCSGCGANWQPFPTNLTCPFCGHKPLTPRAGDWYYCPGCEQSVAGGGAGGI